MTAIESLVAWLGQNWGVLLATLPGWISLLWLLTHERPVIDVELLDVSRREPSGDSGGFVLVDVEIGNSGRRPTTLRDARLAMKGTKSELRHGKRFEWGIIRGQPNVVEVYTDIPAGGVIDKELIFTLNEPLGPGEAKLILTFTSGKRAVKKFRLPSEEI